MENLMTTVNREEIALIAQNKMAELYFDNHEGEIMNTGPVSYVIADAVLAALRSSQAESADVRQDGAAQAATIPNTDPARQFPLYELAPDLTLIDRDPQCDERLKLYRDVFAEITAKAIPVTDPASDDPERVRYYRLPVGPLHRAAGKLGFQLFNGENYLAEANKEIERLRAALRSPQAGKAAAQNADFYIVCPTCEGGAYRCDKCGGIGFVPANNGSQSPPKNMPTRRDIAKAMHARRYQMDAKDTESMFALYDAKPEGTDRSRMAIYAAYRDADAVLSLFPREVQQP